MAALLYIPHYLGDVLLRSVIQTQYLRHIRFCALILYFVEK